MRRLQINSDDLTEESCSALATVLPSSSLRELDLSNNNLPNSGVKKLCEALKNPFCKLETLSLSSCSVTDEGYSALTSALKENPKSDLKKLDLSGNDPGEKGVELITSVFMNSNKTLRLLKSDAAEEACSCLEQILGKNPLLQEELDLSNIKPEKVSVNQLSALLEDPHCRLQKLTIYKISITERDCAELISALLVNPSHLRVLDLNKNKIDGPGLQKLSDLLKNPHCRLEKLCLSSCCISEEGYAALASALESNPSSNLIELDLRDNDPGETGVKLLTDLQNNPHNKLKTIRLLNSSAAEDFCASLTEALGTNPLLLTELNLYEKITGDSAVKQLSKLLKDLHCRTKILKLNNCSITERGCAALSAALCSNPSHLIKLDLSGNKLGDSGVKEISHLLKNSNSKLELLNFSDCSVSEKGYAALASALKSNTSSHLIELDLRGNDPGNRSVMDLHNLRQDPKYKLKTMRLLKTAADEAWTSLSSALGMNVLLQTELNLNRNPAGLSGDSRVKLLCDLLQDTHCKLRKLHINDDDLTEKSCSALATVLTSSTLRELDLSNNNLQNSGVDFLCSALKNHLCKLETLSLSFCSVTEGGYAALAKALQLNSSLHLQLDLRGNDPGDTGVNEITKCKLKKLRLLKSEAAEQAFRSIEKQLKINPLLKRELDLSTKKPKDINVMELTALLEDPHCRLQKLTMYKVAGRLDFSADMTEQDCATLVSSLIKNPSHLRELDLNGNKLHQSALQKLCDLLKNPLCRLEKLKLKNCSIEEEGCAALVSALTSKPLQLKELDLSGNPLGESVKKLAELLKESGCVLRVDQSILEKVGNAISYLWPWSNKDKSQKPNQATNFLQWDK